MATQDQLRLLVNVEGAQQSQQQLQQTQRAVQGVERQQRRQASTAQEAAQSSSGLRRVMSKLGPANKRAGVQAGLMANNVSEVGFAVGQAVPGLRQMGTQLAIAGGQASTMGAALGPIGAIAGALAATTLPALVKALSETEDEMQSVESATDTAVDDLQSFIEKAKEAERAQRQLERAKLAGTSTEVRAQRTRTAQQITELQKKFRSAAEEAGVSSERIQEALTDALSGDKDAAVAGISNIRIESQKTFKILKAQVERLSELGQKSRDLKQELRAQKDLEKQISAEKVVQQRLDDAGLDNIKKTSDVFGNLLGAIKAGNIERADSIIQQQKQKQEAQESADAAARAARQAKEQTDELNEQNKKLEEQKNKWAEIDRELDKHRVLGPGLKVTHRGGERVARREEEVAKARQRTKAEVEARAGPAGPVVPEGQELQVAKALPQIKEVNEENIKLEQTSKKAAEAEKLKTDAILQSGEAAAGSAIKLAQVLGASTKEIASLQATLEIAKGIADIAEGTWPPNPAAIAAGAAHFASAGVYATIAGTSGGESQKQKAKNQAGGGRAGDSGGPRPQGGASTVGGGTGTGGGDQNIIIQFDTPTTESERGRMIQRSTREARKRHANEV